MCGSVFQRGHSGGEYLSSSILFKYKYRVGHLLVLSWDMVRRVSLGVLFGVMYVEWFYLLYIPSQWCGVKTQDYLYVV